MKPLAALRPLLPALRLALPLRFASSRPPPPPPPAAEPADDYILDVEEEAIDAEIQGLLEPELPRSVIYEPGSNRHRLQQAIEPLYGSELLELYETLDYAKQIEPSISALRDEFQFNDEELKYLLTRHKELLTPKLRPQAARRFFVDQLGLSLDTVKSMVLRGPIVLFKDEAFLADQMAFFTTKFRYTEVEAVQTFLDVPDLLKWSGTYHFQEMLDLFDIYLQWDTDKVRALFKASPWMMAQTLNQLEAYLRLFKMYKFDRDVLYEVLLKDGSIFGNPPSVLRQSVRLLRKNFKYSAGKILSEVFLKHPEFMVQSKFKALETKLHILRDHGCSDLMLRRVFQHYPQFYLKSISSFKAKVKYLSKNCLLELETNPYFPLCLMFDFRTVMYPRLECLLAAKRDYDLAEVLRASQEEFCSEYGIAAEEVARRREGTEAEGEGSKGKEERDILWRYVANL